MKALLIWPKVPPTYCGYEHILPIIGKKAANIPLGILTVAALLPKSWELKFIDMNTTTLDEEIITDFDPDLVFVSATQIQKESFMEVIQLCNKLYVPVVAGGPYPTHNYEQIKGVSVFVLHEAEVTLPKFLEDFEGDETLKYIYDTEEKANLTVSPPPRLDLINLDDYVCASVQTSRGCPFNCKFCDIVSLFGRDVRTKTISQILAEFDQLYALGWRGNVFIADDNFIGKKARAKMLLITIADWQREHHYPFSLFTQTSIDVAEDLQLLRFFREAGFGMLFIGIETPNEDALNEVGKKQNLIDLMHAVHTIQDHDIEVVGGFIVGFDHDTSDIFQQQIKFIEKASIPSAVIGILTALPGTELYNELKAEGRLLGESSGTNTHATTLNFTPKMGYDALQQGYTELMQYLYTPTNYFNRCLSLLKRLPDTKGSRKFRLIYLWWVLKALHIQLFSGYAFSYITYLVKALYARPRLVAEIFRLGIEGHHFFKMVNLNDSADWDSPVGELETTLHPMTRENHACLHNYKKILEGGNKHV